MAVGAGAAWAHFNVVLPERYAGWEARKGERVPMRFVWGHGYEHVWFDALAPSELFVVAPDGTKSDLRKALKPLTIEGAGGKARAWRFELRPEERGDYVLVLKAALLWDEEGGCFLQDWARSTLHVQVKKGWDRTVGLPFELVPLTRPYALQPGQVVRARLLRGGRPLAGCEVELEKLQPRRPRTEELPGEELITFESKTDEAGIVTFGFHEPGWFALTAVHETGQELSVDGHTGPLVERTTLWVHVAPLKVLGP
jgi:cobalt/nickel transport protein